MRKRLNLNPKSIEKEKKTDHFAVLIIIYILITLVLLCNGIIIYLNNNKLEKKNTELSEVVSSYKNENSSYINVYNELQREKNFVKKVNSLEKDNNVWKSVKYIGKYMPNTININSINLSNGTMTIGGMANNNNEVAIFLANLQMSDLYKNAEVVTMKNIQVNDKDENNIKDNKEKKINTKSAVEFNISIEGVGQNEKNEKGK